MNPLLGRWISADPLAVHAPGEADLNVYAYVTGHILKAIDPLGLDKDPLHSVAQENYRNATAERAGEVAGEQAELTSLQDSYLATLGDPASGKAGDPDASASALAKLEAHEQKMADTAAAWEEKKAQLERAIDLTRDTLFADGTVSSLRLYGQAHDLKRLNEEVEAVKSTGALAPAYVVHEAIDPAQSRDEKMVRLSRYGAANAALEMKGTVRGGRPPTGQSQTTVDGHTTKQNSVESRKAHQTPSAGKKVSAPPKPPKRAAPTRSEGQKDSDWAEGFKRVVDAWFD